MRTTIQALLCSLAACAAPIGGNYGDDDDVGPDAGVDGGGTVTGCPSGEEITKTMDFTVSGTTNFSNVPTQCWRLNGKLTVSGVAVTSLAKLGDLRGVKDLVIENTSLTKLDTTTAFQVEGAIRIVGNAKLADLTNLEPSVTQIPSLVIDNNLALANLGGLSKVTRVMGETTITNNPKLTAIGLGQTNRIEGALTILDNALVTSVDLKALTSVGNLTLRRNAQLSTLSLSALQYVHGSLTIDDNDNLLNLSGLGPTVTIDIGVFITNNAKLSSLNTLARATYIGGAVTFTGNPALDATAAHELDCCVNSGTINFANNKDNTCEGGHWCIANGGNCPFAD